MTEEVRENWQELDDFALHWDDQGLWHWHGQQIVIHECSVQYEWKKKSRVVITKVHFYHNGKIYLEDSGWLNSEDHYCEFSMSWQDYSVTDEFDLRISGNGPKASGNYSLVITPVRSSA